MPIAAVAAAPSPPESALALELHSRMERKVVALVVEEPHLLPLPRRKHPPLRPQPTAAHLSILLVARMSVTAKEDNSSLVNAFPTPIAVAVAAHSPQASAQDLALPSRTASRVAASVEEEHHQQPLVHPKPKLQHRELQHPEAHLLPPHHPTVALLSTPLVPRTLVTAKASNSLAVNASAPPTVQVDAVPDPQAFAPVSALKHKTARPDVDSLRRDSSGGRQVFFQPWLVERKDLAERI